MSAGDLHRTPDDALARRMEAILGDTAALNRAMTRLRRVRLALFLAVLALVVVILVMFYRLGSHLVSDENVKVLMATGEKRFGDRTDFYVQQVGQLVDGTSPAVSQAFSEQAKKDLPTYYESVGKESDKLVEDLQTKLADKVGTHYQQYMDKHEEKIKKEFPEVKDDEAFDRMKNNLTTALQHSADKYYAQELRKHMDDLIDTWYAFPAAEPPAKGEMSLEDQFVAHLWELLALKLSHTTE